MNSRLLRVAHVDLLENAPVILALHDTDHRVVWGNKAYRDAVGKSPPEFEGETCYSAWGLHAPCEGCPAARAIETGATCDAELTADNQTQGTRTRREWLSRATPVRDGNGQIVGALEAIFDIAPYAAQYRNQKKTTAALMRLLQYATTHTTRELLREFLDEAEALTGSRIGFYHFVEEDQTTLSLQMWSTNTQQVCTAPGAGMRYPFELAGVWVDCVREGVPVVLIDYANLPHRIGLPDGHVPVVRELVVPVIRDGKLVAILGVGNKEADYDEQDVKVVEQLAELAWETDVRKRAEEEGERLQQQIAQMHKLEAVGQLAGGVAHDFNNLLMGITNYVDLCRDTIEADHPAREWLDEVTATAQRSADLVRQLLAFARKQVIAPKVLDLNDAVEDMLKLLRRLIGENIDLRWEPGPGLWPVNVDPSQIDQLLANLCVNARDAISGVGRVSIETANVTLDAEYCAGRPELVPGDFVQLAVSDDGCGMDAETLEKAFEPFFTTKKHGQGTGLGLATVYGIARQNGGFVTIFSQPGDGATFRVFLPKAADVIESESVDASAELPGGDATVLLVEDDNAVRHTTRVFLENLGYNVLPAASSEEAASLSTEHRGPIPLLLTDVVLPDMNGRRLAEQLTERRPEMKCLFMSGHTTDDVADRGVLDTDVDFLPKPVPRDQLARRVFEVLQNPPHSPSKAAR